MFSDISSYLSNNDETKKKITTKFISQRQTKITKQIELEKEFVEYSNNKAYMYSFEKYFKNTNKESVQTIPLSSCEVNHIANFYLNISNFLSIFLDFFPFLYKVDYTTNELIFEKRVGITLREYLEDEGIISPDELHTILKVVCYNLGLLNNLFSFTHYNFTLDDILIYDISSKLDQTHKNYFIKDIIYGNSDEHEKDIKNYILPKLENGVSFVSLPFKISLNYNSLNIKNSFFKLFDNKSNLFHSFSFVNTNELSNNIKTKMIKVDRNNILSDIFNIFKYLYIGFNIDYLKEFFVQTPLKESDKEILRKIHNIESLHQTNINTFLDEFFEDDVTNISLNEYLKDRYPKGEVLNSPFLFLDIIELFDTQHTDYIEELSADYIKNINNSYFIKNLNRYVVNNINKENNDILFYVFCMIKNYFFEDESSEIVENAEKIYKEKFNVFFTKN